MSVLLEGAHVLRGTGKTGGRCASECFRCDSAASFGMGRLMGAYHKIATAREQGTRQGQTYRWWDFDKSEIDRVSISQFSSVEPPDTVAGSS